MARPSPGKRQGLPFSLNRWKLEALRQVRFRVGKGYKKYRALEEVGQAIGQSSEALRTWEKELEKSRDRFIDLYCSELAGIYNQYFRGLEKITIPETENNVFHRGISNFERAGYLHREITETKMDEIREKIKHYRNPKAHDQ